MNLEQWAAKWNIPYQAIHELRIECGMVNTDPKPIEEVAEFKSEAYVQNKIRLEASKKGLRLWRNNVGACYDDNGNFIRYGLCNDSKRMNVSIKSSDLIGLRSITITAAHVGRLIAQFTAREAKPEGWEYTGKDHEIAQLKFIELINSMGGDAAFATKEGTL